MDRRNSIRVLYSLGSAALAAAILASVGFAAVALGPASAGSPYMLFVLAVLSSGLVCGPFWGGAVLVACGLLGLYLFQSPLGAWPRTPLELAPLGLFWVVGGAVLMTANALRRALADGARGTRRRS